MSNPVTISVAVQPFTVPNFVRLVASAGKREDGFHESPPIALRDLKAEVLEQMCAEFRRAVLEKAGKPLPEPTP